MNNLRKAAGSVALDGAIVEPAETSIPLDEFAHYQDVVTAALYGRDVQHRKAVALATIRTWLAFHWDGDAFSQEQTESLAADIAAALP